MTGWTLVTVTFNSAEELEKHWQAARPDHVEWIVVDNASSDGSADVARGLGAVVIPLGRNVGFGAANNLAYRQSGREHVCFVNPDVTVDYASLAQLADSLENRGGLVAPQLMNPDGSPQPNGRMEPSLANKIGGRLGWRRARDRYYTVADPHEEVNVAWMMGAAVAGRRSDLARMGANGPWDEAFFVYYEDSDLGLRAWLAGMDVRIVGGARWEHGWARETKHLRLAPWMRELTAMRTFYSRYPELITSSRSSRRFGAVRQVWGRRVDVGEQ